VPGPVKALDGPETPRTVACIAAQANHRPATPRAAWWRSVENPSVKRAGRCHTSRVDDYEARLNAKLAPDSMKQTLIRAGAFLSAYELIKLQVIDGVHDFYWHGEMRAGRKVYDDVRYQAEVTARDKNPFRASCAWLIECGAITQQQAHVLKEVYEHRHEVAHELPRIVIDPDVDVRTDLLLAAAGCLRSLGIFWGRMTVDADPQWDGVDVSDDDIWGGPDLLMGSLLEIAGLVPSDIA
jgi:hypothetical protein